VTTLPWLNELSVGLSRQPSPVEMYSDFGGVLIPPRALVQTISVPELLHVFEVAKRHQIAIALRGSGHSSGGHTEVPAGILLQHCPPDQEIEITEDTIDVPAHWSWSRVEQALQVTDRDLRVTTSCVETSVAGTLSVGGFGPRSVCYGPQVDQVCELRLVGANGELIRCSAHDSPELFFSALTGVGRVGLIERVVLRTVPRRSFLACAVESHTSFGKLAASIQWLADAQRPGPDYFCVLAKHGRLESFCAASYSTREEAESRGRAAGQEWGRAGVPRVMRARDFERDDRRMPVDAWRGCRHLWSDYCFEGEAFVRFAEFIDRTLSESLREHIAYVLCAAPRVGEPFALDMRPASRQRLFSVGLFYSVPSQSVQAIEHARAAHRRALEQCLALGGRPYLYGLWGGRGGLSSSELQSFFGPSYARLRAARQRLDPAGILNPNALN